MAKPGVINVVPKNVGARDLLKLKSEMWNSEQDKILIGAGTKYGRHVNFYQLWHKHPLVFYALIGLLLYRVYSMFKRKS